MEIQQRPFRPAADETESERMATKFLLFKSSLEEKVWLCVRFFFTEKKSVSIESNFVEPSRVFIPKVTRPVFRFLFTFSVSSF